MAEPAVEKVTRKGLSVFLARHEQCGGGFEVQRREGSTGPIVRVVCGGCGQMIEYPAALDEDLSAAQLASLGSSQRRAKRDTRTSRAGAGEPDAPKRTSGANPRRTGAPRAEDDPPRRPRSGERSIGWRSWVPGLIAGLIGGALVLIVIAIASGGGSSDDGSNPSQQSTRPGTTPTAPASTAPTSSTPTSVAKRPSKPRRAAVRLERRQLADRVSIGVPRGWSAGISGGGVTIVAGDGDAEVQVYYELGVKPDVQLAEASKRFLLERHPTGRVASVGVIDAAGRKARRVKVKYATGTESAVVLVADGYSYLILSRLDKPSSAEMRRTTAAVALSFRPA